MGKRSEAAPGVIGVMARHWVKQKDRRESQAEPCPDCIDLACSQPVDLATFIETGHHPNCPTARRHRKP